ncbi:hypothetical protein A4A49_52747, partial [Nicotiana attenuata]
GTNIPPRKDNGKGKATSTVPSKAKAAFAPPLKKRKWGKLFPVKQPLIHNLKDNGSLASKAYPHTLRIGTSVLGQNIYHLEAAIHERRLQAKYQAIWKGINGLGLIYVFRNSGDINVNLVIAFYASFEPEDPEQLMPIWGRLIDFLASTICNFLGAPDVPQGPLDNFIIRCTYRELRHTLCGVNSVVAWVRDKKTNRHRKFLKKNMKAEAQDVRVVFLNDGPKNVGHLICYQMTQVQTGKKIDRVPFANMLTQYLRQEEVEEKKEFDHIIAPSLRVTDLTNVLVKEENPTTSLTGAEPNARDDNFMAHLYGMMDLQLRIGRRSATTEERAILEQQFLLNAHAQQLDEDVNTPEQSEAELKQSDDDDDEAQDEEWAASEEEGDDAV